MTGLSLGDAIYLPLKTFLQKHAKLYHQRHLARTYGVFDKDRSNKIVAYITLVCGEIVLEGNKRLLDEPDLKYNYKSYPAVKIARLAVHEDYRDEKLGSLLVEIALGTAKDIICPAIGCRFVAVDSKTEAVKFYERKGFSILDTPKNRRRSEPVMFIDLHKAS